VIEMGRIAVFLLLSILSFDAGAQSSILEMMEWEKCTFFAATRFVPREQGCAACAAVPGCTIKQLLVSVIRAIIAPIACRCLVP
jgi:hypothetical protein